MNRRRVLKELDSAIELLTEWRAAVQGEGPVPDGTTEENGLPMLDYPASQDAFEEALRALAADLVVAASKCETLAEVVAPR